MITSNVINRVLRIRFGDSEGTAFTIEVDGREYVVTATHVVESIGDDDRVEIFGNGAWRDISVQLVGHAGADIDVSVLAASRQVTPTVARFSMPPTREGITYGQDVFFWGFPYGFVGGFVLAGEGYPLPFVKRATLSLFDRNVLYLDGHNNPGFSGGPVVFSMPGQYEYKVGAVISGFRAVHEPVYASGQESGLTVLYNTGIIVAHPIDSALELIRAKPIGHEL